MLVSFCSACRWCNYVFQGVQRAWKEKSRTEEPKMKIIIFKIVFSLPQPPEKLVEREDYNYMIVLVFDRTKNTRTILLSFSNQPIVSWLRISEAFAVAVWHDNHFLLWFIAANYKASLEPTTASSWKPITQTTIY